MTVAFQRMFGILKRWNNNLHQQLMFLNNKPIYNSNENKVEHRISLPFFDKLSQNLGKMFHKAGIQTVYEMNNELNSQIIKRGKDIFPKENTKGVAYELNCYDYDAVYVITDNRIDSGHAFGWKDNQILNRESNYFKSDIAEMLHIKSNNN